MTHMDYPDFRLGNTEYDFERDCGRVMRGCSTLFLIATIALAGGAYYIQKAFSRNESQEVVPYSRFLEKPQEDSNERLDRLGTLDHLDK